jgi:hypothetical protein
MAALAQLHLSNGNGEWHCCGVVRLNAGMLLFQEIPSNDLLAIQEHSEQEREMRLIIFYT